MRFALACQNEPSYFVTCENPIQMVIMELLLDVLLICVNSQIKIVF